MGPQLSSYPFLNLMLSCAPSRPVRANFDSDVSNLRSLSSYPFVTFALRFVPSGPWKVLTHHNAYLFFWMFTVGYVSTYGAFVSPRAAREILAGRIFGISPFIVEFCATTNRLEVLSLENLERKYFAHLLRCYQRPCIMHFL